MKKVAVLVPTFKPGDYLKQCLLSIDRQTLPGKFFRVYIALNGPRSPYEDYILEVLKSMSFEYEYLYIPKPGVSRARNKLMEVSSEEYIVFIDDDDVISENYLENLLNVTDTEYMGIANVYSFENNITNLKENYIGKSFKKLNDIETSKFKARKYFSSICGKMLHRSMVQGFKFDENVQKGEDSLFMATISKNIVGVRKTSDNTVYYVYERPGSTTRSKGQFFYEVKTLLYLIYQYIKLLLKKDYDKAFILTRIVATFLKLVRILNPKYKYGA